MERHNLIKEFPEHKEKIHDLKLNNIQFKKLFDEYDELEHEIHKINTGEKIVIDEQAHILKAKLLHLKDHMYEMLKD